VISPSPNGYAYIQMERRIVTGGSEFLAKAHRVGKQVLGYEAVTSVSELMYPINDDAMDLLPEPVTVVEPIVKPLMTITDHHHFDMMLVHRAVRNDLASRYSLGFHQGRLAARRGIRTYEKLKADNMHSRAEVRKPSLADDLQEVSVKAGLDPERLTVVCDKVGIIGEPGRDIILALFPDPTKKETLLLYRQAELCLNRLETQSKRIAFPTNPWEVSAPFARIPEDISSLNYERLMQRLQEVVAHTRVVVAEPTVNGIPLL